MTAAAAGGLASLGTTAPARAIEPIERSYGPMFKFSLAAYSYRELLTGNPPKLTLFDFLNDCAAMQLEGTEPTSYYFPEGFGAEYLCKLKAHAFKLGLDISGTAIRNDFCLPPGPKRDEEMAHARQWIDHATLLGAPVIRVFSGKQAKGQSLEEAHRLCVEGMEEACAYAGTKGVFLALENHGGLTATAEGLLKLVRDVQSPWFGVNYDSGNFHQDPYAELEQIAPYALNVQIKVVVSDEGKQNKRPSDFKRLAQMLRAVGYRGYIVLEFEEKEDPREACPKYIARIREAFA